ncbi:MAG: hypothetical protein LIQ26_06415 [Bacteroidota bacterium]|nr:hypothetical protein [Bacteroidota bacterium]
MAYPYTPVNYGYSPAMYAQPVPQNATGQSQSNVIYVQGEAGARAYMVAPGNTVLLMDSENPVFYWKTADASGMPTLRAFDFTERTAPAPAPVPAAAPAYITREEFEEFKKSLKGESDA